METPALELQVESPSGGKSIVKCTFVDSLTATFNTEYTGKNLGSKL